MKQKRIWLSIATMSGHEQEFVQEAFDTNWITSLGPNVKGFENDLQKYMAKECHVVALSSGTAALHLAMIQLGISPKDEVLCQSFTFAASANPISYLHATPVFVDSEPDTWNMSPELLESAIIDRKKKTGKYPKAIVLVHLYGMPAKLDEILSIAQHYGIPVIEDSAEALGSEYKGIKCGTFGEMGILSFNGNKIITTSGGGALVCRTPEQANRALFLATQARENRPYYHHEQIGYNYRLSNVSAGIGRGQMTVLSNFVERRREIHALYEERLCGAEGIHVMCAPSDKYKSNFWLTCITVERQKSGITPDSIREHLETKNIESRLLWKPLHLQPVFASCPAYTNGVSASLFATGLCLPSSPSLTNEEIERIVEDVIEAKEKLSTRQSQYAAAYV